MKDAIRRYVELMNIRNESLSASEWADLNSVAKQVTTIANNEDLLKAKMRELKYSFVVACKRRVAIEQAGYIYDYNNHRYVCIIEDNEMLLERSEPESNYYEDDEEWER